MKKRILSLILALLMVMTLVPAAAFADGEELSGECGENVTWKLEGGTLTISGTGSMQDYRVSPWQAYSDRIEKIVVEEGITRIGENSFAPLNMGDVLVGQMNKAALVSLPQSLESIGNNAFSFCSGLESIVLPPNLKSIGISAFKGCTSLTEINIPDSVNNIGIGAFSQCTSLKSIIIPSGISAINEWAFSYCEQLEKVQLPDGLTVIGDQAFTDCKSLKTVALPKTLKAICSGAFSGCSGMDVAVLPDGLESIGYQAFYGCEKLTEVKIPDSVTKIGGAVFADCSSLENIEIPSDWTSLKGIYDRCTGLREIAVPDGFTELVDGEFYGCTNLEKVILPDSINAIGKRAFSGCLSIKSVIIPEGVTEIGEYCFESCTALNEVYLPKSLKAIDVNSFSDCGALESIYYGGSLRQWKEWVTFTGEYSPNYDETNDGLVNASIYFAEETDPFTDIDCAFHDHIVAGYAADILNGYPDNTFRPFQSVTRAQFVTMLYNMCGKPDLSGYGELEFKDTSSISSAYKDAVLWGYLGGIVSGYSDGTFRPNERISRAQMATFAYRLLKELVGEDVISQYNTDSNFTDSGSIADSYREAVNVMSTLEIINGYEDGSFRPNATATRGAAAKIIVLVASALFE